jgi:glucose/arabinose dehydrogenase
VGVRNRVSRFLENGQLLTNEEVILEGPYLSVASNHNGGTLRFAPDETLFVSMGDNDTDALANPASRDLNDLRGKSCADRTIPPDNPSSGSPAGARRSGLGLRNRFALPDRPQTGDVIGDVGEHTWEEIISGSQAPITAIRPSRTRPVPFVQSGAGFSARRSTTTRRTPGPP